MAQKIKVQDGNILYVASDSTYDVNFGINGLLTVTKEIMVGDIALGLGTITTSPAQNLTITTGLGANLLLQPDAALILNGVQWPVAPISTSPGSYLGASALNTLEFYSFVFASSVSDSLTPGLNPITGLDFLYPTIQPGQVVVGPTVVYDNVGTNQWRILQPRLGYTPVNIAGDTMTGYLMLNADPTTGLGAVTKQYVDQISTGINIHGSVETSTTPLNNLTPNSYTNGSSGGGFDLGGQGVGATLTSVSNVYINTLGIGGDTSISVGSRILVKDQTNIIENGVYTVTNLGAEDPGGFQWMLTRATDYDNSQANEVRAGDVIYIQEGTLSGTQWVQTSTGTGQSNATIIGTDNITFTQFSGVGAITSGPGIDVTGNVISNTGVISNIASTGISISGATGAVTITNTGVTSLTTNTGLSTNVSATGAVTITNTGVLSFNTRTGAITLTSLDVTTALGYTPGSGSGTVSSIGMTVPAFLSVSPSPITTSGTFAVTLSGTALPIANGGTGQTTANAAINALVPDQTANGGKLLTTDGTNTSWANQIWLSPTSSVAIGPAVTAPELSTTATDGFFYIPSCAGVPTGVPTNIPGRAPMVIDSVNNRLYIYAGGSWIALNLAVYS
jgi:hypothetical protein